MAVIDELLDQASEIRDADQEKENTAMRVGTMLINILQHVAKFVDTDTLRLILEDYASLERNLIRWRQSRIVCLASMGDTLDNIDGGSWSYTEHDNDIVYSESNKVLRVVGATGNYTVLPGVVYVNLHTGHSYTWDATSGAMVELTDSGGPVVINYRNTPRFEDVAVGETYYYESGATRRIAIKVSASSSHSFEIDPGAIYAFRDVGKVMIWDTGSSAWVPVGGDSGGSIDATTYAAIKAHVNLLASRYDALLEALANLAFEGTRPQAIGQLVWPEDAATPMLTQPAVGSTIDVGEIASDGTSVQRAISVKGSNLTKAVSLSVTGTGFSVSPSTLTAAAVNAGANVTIKYSNSGTGDGTAKTGTLSISSDEVIRTVSLLASKAAEEGGGDTPVVEDDYISDGLVLNLDGTDRGGASGHWVDKVDGYDFALGSGATEQAKGVQFDANDEWGTCLSQALSNALPGYNAGTIEVCFTPLSGFSATNTPRTLFLADQAAKICAIYANYTSSGITFFHGAGGYSQENAIENCKRTIPAIESGLQRISANTARLVQNGVLNSNGTSSGSMQYSNKGIGVMIGGRSGSSVTDVPAMAVIHAIRVYSRQLTESEMSHNQAIDLAKYGN